MCFDNELNIEGRAECLPSLLYFFWAGSHCQPGQPLDAGRIHELRAEGLVRCPCRPKRRPPNPVVPYLARLLGTCETIGELRSR